MFRRSMGLMDLFWPQVCPVCEREVSGRSRVHARCLNRIELADRIRGTGTPVVAHFEDGPEWFRILHQWKYGGERALGEVVAEQMSRSPPTALQGAVLVPMPDDRARRLERGFSPVSDLADALGRRLSLPRDPSLIVRRGSARSQTRCRDDLDRRRNVAQVFRTGDLARRPESALLILVEDQVTSGATVTEAARLLRARGSRVIVWCAARASRAPRGLA